MRKMSFYIGLLSLNLISGVVLASSFVSATDDEVVDSVQLTVPIACTMTGTGTTHTAILNPGTYSGESGSEYENGIGKTTLTAICNDDNGFSIYAIGYTGNQYEGENHTKLIGQSTSSTIATKAYTSGDTTSNWSMKLTKVTDTTESYNPQNLTIQSDTEGTFSSWHSVPASYTKVAEYHANTGSSTTDTTLGVKLETTYAAYIASNQSADTYEGQVKYTMVHPYTEEPLQPQSSASGKICYYANASDAEGTMGCQDVANSVTLLASNFSRTSYGFAGWSDKFDYATNPEAKFYGPQETMAIPDTSIYTGDGKGLSLYAVWVKSAGNLQDTTKVATLCGTGTGSLIKANEATNILSQSITALSDARDNNTYAIAKLADGKCWMIENLRLDNSVSLTLVNTNNPLNDGTNVTIKHSYSDTETHNTLSASQDPTTTAWCQSNSASCDDQSMLFTGNTTNRASYETGATMTNSANIYSYGNYYNWYSATAGRGTYGFSTNNNSVAGDLCPAGWHLPIGGRKANVDVSDFWKLSRATIGADPANFANDYFYYTGTPEGTDASNKMRAYPNNFVYSGNVNGGSVGYRGSSGSFWSSTARSSLYAYYLYLLSSYVYPGTYYNYKYYGRTVRCVAPGV
ncbi:hypothetical protein IJI28_01550 [Candidatus Saccharibacteria bacterium]|nr:hypothetical protein [Candidatus Saccharibacteria bacterium]